MIRLLEVFKIGIGPSSSHTVGPMRAAYNFAYGLVDPERVAKIRVTFFGSLAWTGRGHASDSAVILGLAGFQPESIERELANVLIASVRHDKKLRLGVRRSTIPSDPAADIVFDRRAPTPVHPNTVRFTALDRRGRLIAEERWCSIGGGTVRREGDNSVPNVDDFVVPYPLSSGNELLVQTGRSGMNIHELAFRNECAVRPAIIVNAYLDGIIDTMMDCLDRGLTGSGELPGMKLKRRAASLRFNLETRRLTDLRPRDRGVLLEQRSYGRGTHERCGRRHSRGTAPAAFSSLTAIANMLT